MSRASPSSHAENPSAPRQVVELHREREAARRREEGLEVEHSDAGDGWLLNPLDQRRELQVFSSLPGGLEDRRDQDVLPALDRIDIEAQQRQQSRRRRRDALSEELRVRARLRVRRREGPQDRHRPAGRRSGREDREVGGRLELRDARAVLGPLREARLPERRLFPRVVIAETPARGVFLVDPGGNPRASSRDVRTVRSPGVDQDRQMPSRAASSMSATQRPVLPLRSCRRRPRGSQVARVVEDDPSGASFREVEAAPGRKRASEFP